MTGMPPDQEATPAPGGRGAEPPMAPLPPLWGSPVGEEPAGVPPAGQPPAAAPPPGYPPPGYAPPSYQPPSYPPAGGYGAGQGYGYPPSAGGPSQGGLAYAGWWARAAAFVIDAVIVGVVSLIVSIPVRSTHFARFTFTSRTGVHTTRYSYSGGSLLVWVVIVLLYGTLFWGSTRGQTPGMMALGMRVLDRDTGTPIGYGRALVRVAVELVLYFVFVVGWVLDVLFPLWDARKQTLHDKAARSVVVRGVVPPPVPGGGWPGSV